MVANKPELTDERLDSGTTLLRMLDDVGFGALGAAWVHDTDTSHWHYLLVSPMIDSKGPRWVHERLLQVYNKLHLPEGITPLDIVVASPRELDIQQLSTTIRVDDGLMQVSDMSIGSLQIDFMLIYRMLPLRRNDAGERARAFDARVQQLMAA